MLAPSAEVKSRSTSLLHERVQSRRLRLDPTPVRLRDEQRADETDERPVEVTDPPTDELGAETMQQTLSVT